MADEMNSSSENPCGNATDVSDYLVPMKTIESFLRYVRNDTDVIAVRIANEALDHGAPVDQILAFDRGLRISVTANRDGSYDFHASCIAGSGRDVVGDGGTWKVDVDHDGNVIRAIPEGRVFYD
jgi:hypothetical protein